MKRIAGFAIGVLLAWGPAAAGSGDVIFLARGAHFRPSDTMYRQIYGGGIAFSLEIGVPLWKNVEVWAEGGYFSRTGALTLTGEPTRLWSLPGGAGLRYVLPLGPLRVYAGAGGGYFKFVEQNRIGTFVAGRLGVVAKAGVFLSMRPGIVVDASVKYSACQMPSDVFEFGVGGFEAGLGIGYRVPGSFLRRREGGEVQRDFSLSMGVTSGRFLYSWRHYAQLWFGAALDLRLARSLMISPEVVSVPGGFVTVAPGVLLNYEIGPGFIGGGLSVPIVMSGAGNPGAGQVTPKFNFGIRFGHARVVASFSLKEGHLDPSLGIGYQGIGRAASAMPPAAGEKPAGKLSVDFSLSAGLLAYIGDDGGSAVVVLGGQADFNLGRTVMLSPELNLLTNFSGGASVLPGVLLNFKTGRVFAGLGVVYFGLGDEGGMVLPKFNAGIRGKRISGALYLITSFEGMFEENLFGARVGYRF